MSETFVVFNFPSSGGFTYSINGSLVLAGALRRGSALRTALVRRNPQTLALQREHTHTQVNTHTHTRTQTVHTPDWQGTHNVSINQWTLARNKDSATDRQEHHEESLKRTLQRRYGVEWRLPGDVQRGSASPGSREKKTKNCSHLGDIYSWTYSIT